MNAAIATAVQRIQCASREDWLAKRWAQGFGASEAAAFFGHGWQGKGALSVVMDKVRPLEITPSTEKQRIALALETTIGNLYARKDPPQPMSAYAEPYELYFLRDAPCVFATPDAFATFPDHARLVQFKTDARTPEAWEQGVPLAYQIQAQQEMYATGIDREDFAVLFYGEGNLAFRVYELDANPSFQRILVAKETAAWEVVLALRAGKQATLPEPSADDTDVVASLCQPKPTIVHQFTAEEAEIAARWSMARDNRLPYTRVAKALEDLEKHEKNRLLMRMRGAEFGVLPDGTKLKVTAREREVSAREDKWLELAPFKERKSKVKEIEAGE